MPWKLKVKREEFPSFYTVSTYDEEVAVHDGIAIVQNEFTKDRLLRSGEFDLVGLVDAPAKKEEKKECCETEKKEEACEKEGPEVTREGGEVEVVEEEQIEEEEKTREDEEEKKDEEKPKEEDQGE